MAVTLLAVGSFTEAYVDFRAKGEGLSLIGLDDDAGTLTRLDLLAAKPNPSFLRWRSERIIHAVLEANDARAGLVTIGVDGAAGRLRLLDQTSLDGRIPCAIDVDPSGVWLASACYGSGDVTIHGLTKDRPGPAMSARRHEGRSVHPTRQQSPHPHAACFAPDGAWLLVPDLGTDEVVSYPFDGASGALGEPVRYKAPPGSGPRLVLFSPDGRFAILIEELASRVVSLRWDSGRLEPVQSCPTTTVEPNTAAGLRWHPSGRLFAASNRGADTVQLFAFDPATGGIAPAAVVPSGGKKPRDFDFSPSGRWLIASNQDGDTLAVYRIEGERLTDTGTRLTLASPSCVRFLA